MNEKTIKPPYTSYKSFETLITELRSHEVLPDVIDRSLALLRKRSGSEQAALIAALKWFKLIDPSTGARTALLDEYLGADEDRSKVILKKMIEDSFAAITDGSFNLKTATTQQMTDKFRSYEISGSTLAKCILFFLAASKEAGIQVSPHVKAPPVVAAGPKRKSKNSGIVLPPTPTPDQPPPARHSKPQDDTMISIPIPIAGKDGAILLPKNMTDRQWTSVVKMIEFIINNYRETMAEEEATAKPEEEDDDI